MISGYGEDDTVLIPNGTWSTTKSGSDILITVGDDSITLSGAASLKAVNIVNNTKANTLITGTSHFDSITNTGSNVTITTSTPAVVRNEAANVSIQTGADDDGITCEDATATIFGGSGNDTLKGGTLMSGDTGNDVFVHTGGAVTITDYTAGADKISLNGATLSTYALNGNDVILNFGDNDSLTVSAGKGKKITFAEGKKSGVYIFEEDRLFNSGKTAVTLTSSATGFDAGSYSALVTINASASDNTVELIGNAKNNVISANDKGATLKGGAGNDKLRGGAGTDSLWGGDGADTFFYAKGDGKDYIYGFSNDDQLTLKVGSTIIAVFKEFTASTFNVDLNGTRHQITKWQDKKFLRRKILSGSWQTG